jgi:peptidoglycan/LPS O-acetylase OafA/YrhL
MVRYRADVDGLRAVAVLPVLLFHAGVAGFEGGFVGVDIFFVISGYVITLRLQSDLDQGKFSIIDFYERRIRRIFPALFFLIALTTIVAAFLFLPPNFEDYSKSVVATALFGSNIYFWKFSGYFEPSAALRPLLHTWSLAVEEQYYIFMPVAMYLIHRFAGGRWLLVLAPVALLSLALSIVATSTAPTANFFLLPTRAWELLLGAMLVLTPPPAIKARALAEASGFLGFALIAYAVFSYTEETPFPGASALAPCLGAALLIYSGTHHRTFAAALLSLKPMVGIGLISYSLYLAHWPIAVFLRYVTLRDPTLAESVLIVAASFALAYISWRFVEQPFRRRGNAFTARRLFIGAGAAIAVTVVVGVIGTATRGLPSRFPGFEHQEIAGREEWKERTCFLMADQSWSDWKPDQCALTKGKAQNALLWGDSFAAHYVPGIIRNADRIDFNVYQYTAAGCQPALSYYSYARPNCQDFNRHAMDVLREFDIKAVVISARWTSLRARGFESIQSTLDALKERGIQTYVIGQSAEFGSSMDLLDYRAGGAPNGSWTTNVDPLTNVELRRVVGDRATFVDPLPFVCDGLTCPFKENGAFLYADFGHFSAIGSKEAVARYFPLAKR